MLAFAAMPRHEDLVLLNKLLETGSVTPVIDRTYPLSAAAEAIGYVGHRDARGKVVITMPGASHN